MKVVTVTLGNSDTPEFRVVLGENDEILQVEYMNLSFNLRCPKCGQYYNGSHKTCSCTEDARIDSSLVEKAMRDGVVNEFFYSWEYKMPDKQWEISKLIATELGEFWLKFPEINSSMTIREIDNFCKERLDPNAMGVRLTCPVILWDMDYGEPVVEFVVNDIRCMVSPEGHARIRFKNNDSFNVGANLLEERGYVWFSKWPFSYYLIAIKWIAEVISQGKCGLDKIQVIGRGKSLKEILNEYAIASEKIRNGAQLVIDQSKTPAEWKEMLDLKT